MGCDILTYGATMIGLQLVGLELRFEICFYSILFTAYFGIIGTVLFADFLLLKSEACNGRNRSWLNIGLVLSDTLIHISVKKILPLFSKYFDLYKLNVRTIVVLILCVEGLWRRQARQLSQDHESPHFVALRG